MPEKLDLSDEEVSRRMHLFREVLKRYTRCKCQSALELCIICWYEMMFLVSNNRVRGPQNMSNIFTKLGMGLDRGSWVHRLAGLGHKAAHCATTEEYNAMTFLKEIGWHDVSNRLSCIFDKDTCRLLDDVYCTAVGLEYYCTRDSVLDMYFS